MRKKYKYNNNFFLTDIFDQDLLNYSKQYSIEEIRNIWLDYIEKKWKNEFINLYLSVPFCKRKCSFCIYATNILIPGKENQQKEEYLKSVLDMLDYYKEIFQKVEFNSFFFWGGTPSILDEDQLEQVSEKLYGLAKFKEWCEKTIECNPDSVTKKKVEIFHKYGYNRISMWVQSLSQETLRTVNRDYQTEKHVFDALKWMSQYDFKEISVDLIYGLAGDSPEKFKDSVIRLLENGATSIIFYCLQPTRLYLKNYFDDDLDVYQEYLEWFFHIFHEINDLLEKKWLPTIDVPENIMSNANGIKYSIKDHNIIFSERYRYNAGIDSSVLGIWHHANSIIKDNIHYHSLPLDKDFRKNEFKGVLFNERMAKTYYIYNKLTNKNHLKLKEYKKEVWSEFTDDFHEEYRELEKKWLMYIEKNVLYFSDTIKNNAKEKFMVGLFFIDMEDIKKRIYDLLWSK